MSLKLLAEPGTVPRLLLGAASPLVVAGPARQTGALRVFVDPCADAYLFGEDSPKPLALDLSGARYGVSLGESAGIWALEADAPRVGMWAGSARGAEFLWGCAAACSVLPAEDQGDTWFSEEPAVSSRLLASGMAWVGYEYPRGKTVIAAALSEEDRGGRGWSARGEGEFEYRGFRWKGRFSAASGSWKGLDGEGADPWEARGDVSWLLAPCLRLECRVRAGVEDAGEADWEAFARADWNGKTWRWKASLEAVDSEDASHIELGSEAYVEREAGALRAFVRTRCVAGGADLVRLEISPGFVLGRLKTARLSWEGAYRREAAGDSWKTVARLEIPSEAGSFSLSFGTADWSRPAAESPVWEYKVSLKARVR